MADDPLLVPYQAYKSKRHSRTGSNPPLVPPNQPAVPIAISHSHHRSDELPTGSRPASSLSNSIPLDMRTNGFSDPPSPSTSSPKSSISVQVIPHTEHSASSLNGKPHGNGDAVVASNSQLDKPLPAVRRQSKFRHVPLRNSKSPLPSSPLRPPGVHTRSTSSSSASHQPDHSHLGASPRSRVTSLSSIAFETPAEKALPPIVSSESGQSASNAPSRTFRPSSDRPLPQPAEEVLSLPPSHPPSLAVTQPSPRAPTPISATPSSAPSVSPTPHTLALPTTHRPSAPYRPGFQPKGVYRPRTDEFLETRTKSHDRVRIERAKLERRLEKLIDLHFPLVPAATVAPPPSNRRASSFFDFDLSDGGMWKGLVLQGGKGDIRGILQSNVLLLGKKIRQFLNVHSARGSSFHPLSNRKHHCRLCGNIICSLPVKHPQRPVTCSLLFVVDANTRQIEEVGEGVDYGVRKRRNSTSLTLKGKEKEDVLSDDDKFLKGVRICRQCRPILLRQQFQYVANHVPNIIKLYHALVILEKEIEDSLPQFQELLLSLNNDGQPTKEASAARKRLLEAFSQYDVLAKRIRNLPTTGGPGNSHHRVQMAIFTRCNLFLQKNMIPLQSIPRSMKHGQQQHPQPGGGGGGGGDASHITADLDSELVRTLQPLLEQEAQLESYVEEAKARRKFEDAKTLKANLAEIRAEIDRIFADADANNNGGGAAQSGGRAKPRK